MVSAPDLYAMLASIKNFLALQESRIKSMPSGLGQMPSEVLAEAYSIQQTLSASKGEMLERASSAGTQLDRLEMNGNGPKLCQEIVEDYLRVEGLLLPEILKRSLFPDIAARKLQTTFTEMQMGFGEVISHAHRQAGLFFYLSCMPCIPNPLKVANQKLQDMELLILDGTEESAWAVLGLFLEAREQAEGYPEFTALMDQCFKNALGAPIDVCGKEFQNVAFANLAAYRQSNAAPSTSILKEQQMRQLGYRRI